MALKSKESETDVKHVFVIDEKERLDEYVKMWIDGGYKLIDCKILSVDSYNNRFSIFYIFVKYPRDVT